METITQVSPILDRYFGKRSVKNKYICWMTWRYTYYLDFRIINYFNHFLSYANYITFHSCKMIFQLLSRVTSILIDKKRFKVSYKDWITKPCGDYSGSLKQIISKSFYTNQLDYSLNKCIFTFNFVWQWEDALALSWRYKLNASTITWYS